LGVDFGGGLLRALLFLEYPVQGTIVARAKA